MKSKSWRVFAASAVFAATVVSVGQSIPAACAVEAAAERIAGFPEKESGAVQQASKLLRKGDYSLALLRLTSEIEDTSAGAQARVFSAYAVLVAGKTLGAFPERS